ncbi:MAG: RidA family protein [Candidatus Handelsmanbacteria bacterium]|nr:RidA family protein [Candidatus Handelsmanbacteria bacterium]
MRIEAKLQDMGIELPVMPAPTNQIVDCRQVGSVVYLSGHGPLRPDGSWICGRVGADLSLAEAQAAARLTAINLLGTLKVQAGDLDRVRQIVKVLFLVNAAPGFTDPPEVADGCSGLLVEVFGEAGYHARSAFGVASLWGGIAVEAEMIVELEASR